jgi:hypothetical protein
VKHSTEMQLCKIKILKSSSYPASQILLSTETNFAATLRQRLSVTHYRNSVFPWWSVYQWIEKLKSGRSSVLHEEGAGCLSMVMNEGNIDRACDMFLLVRQVIVDEVASCMQISNFSTYKIIHNRLEFHQICARWIPKQLTSLYKKMCVWTSANNF